MSVIHSGLFLIMQQFPSERDRLRRLYRSSPSFQTLCDDYQTCTNAIAHWTRSKQEQAPERHREYEELKRSLEFEIEERISEIR